MSIQLYAHPFSSYCQKVLIALYENDIPFEYRVLKHDDSAMMHEFAQLWPLKRFPVLVENGETIVESSIIIEFLALHHPGPVHLLPSDGRQALKVRAMDRFFDNYISTPQQKLVFDAIRTPERRDQQGVEEARALLDTAYGWLDQTLGSQEWAVGNIFSMADCAAAPALFYADWCHPIGAQFKNTKAYRQRLLARPSFARAVDEARPYRGFFPLGAPDRD